MEFVCLHLLAQFDNLVVFLRLVGRMLLFFTFVDDVRVLQRPLYILEWKKFEVDVPEDESQTYWFG